MDIVRIAQRVGEALEESGARYFVGGSVASSLQGDPRSTNDIDLVTDLAPGQVPAFAGRLGPDFSVDEEALAGALARKGSWNIFFLPQFIKIDLFALGASPFDRSEFERRQRIPVLPDLALWIKSPEDTVLRKLLWYRAGGEQSDRQWRDVVEVFRVSSALIDPTYVDRWARDLGLEELVRRAQAQAATRS